MPKPKSQYVPPLDKIRIIETLDGRCAVITDTHTHYMTQRGKWRKLQTTWRDYLFFESDGSAIAAVCQWYHHSQQTQTQKEKEWRKKIGALVSEIEHLITRFKAENTPSTTNRPVGKRKPLRVRRR